MGQDGLRRLALQSRCIRWRRWQLAIFTGYSLMSRKPWGRTLAIVVAVLTLLRFPFGTVLAIYTLWVMAPAESGMEWEAIADRS